MADVRPFRGLQYNLKVVGDLSKVLAPPFDTISPRMQKELYRRSPYNVARLELGETSPADTPENNRYTRASALFNQWLRDQVLVPSPQPCYYLLRHRFNYRGKEYQRLGLMACVRLEEYEKGVVLPHEMTTRALKEDRMALMQACHANFSPIMVLYRGGQGSLGELFQAVQAEPPFAQGTDAEGFHCTLWNISQPERVRAVHQFFQGKPLYLADGHHRYETALAFRDRMREAQGGQTYPDAAYNFVMMTLIDFEDPGLLVLPYHRTVGNLPPPTFTQVRNRLGQLFTIEPFQGRGKEWLTLLLDEVEARGARRASMGLLGPDGEGPYLLTLKEDIDLRREGLLASFEPWVLEEKLLRPVLGADLPRHVAYVHDPEEAVEQVKEGKAQMAFFQRAIPMDLFESIVSRGQRLPPKSTFFYPKLPTGLVINRLEGTL